MASRHFLLPEARRPPRTAMEWKIAPILDLTSAARPLAAVMFSNVLIICTMSIQGKSLAGGTSHDEMVESFGLTWLISGTSLGHIVGAGAILGCQAGGFPGL